LQKWEENHSRALSLYSNSLLERRSGKLYD
jgi:hypothetical protein